MSLLMPHRAAAPAFRPIRNAHFSDDRAYRYWLTIRWGGGPAVVWLMLNPSIADEVRNDPTVARCVAFAQLWGYEAVVVLNLFALVSTDPKALRTHPDPVGPENDRWIADMTAPRPGTPNLHVCAWGEHGGLFDRGATVLAGLKERGVAPYCLAVNKSGHPKHPLYVARNTVLLRL